MSESERGILPTDVVCITVHDFETKYVSRVQFDALQARIRELEAENQELRKDLLFHAVVTEPFTESKCPECGAPAYRMGGQYMECHAGGCSRGKGGTPVLHREGGAK